MAGIARHVNALATIFASSFLKRTTSQISNGPVGIASVVTSPWQQVQQVRGNYVDCRMRRDVRRRRMVQEHGKERLRINSLRKNNIIPRELQEVADQELLAFPRDANPCRIHGRCVVTSRPRAVDPRWRVSRIIWRHLADYNKLSGVTRAWW